MIKQLKNFFSQPLRKHCGNSLTFLLMATTILGLSVAATTVALVPLSSQNQLNSQALNLNAVAEHHLNDIQAFILNHPAIFTNSANYTATAEDYQNDGLPTLQPFTGPTTAAPAGGLPANIPANNFSNYFYANNLLIHNETLQINNGTSVPVTSTLVWNADDSYNGLCTYSGTPAVANNAGCSGDQGRYGIVRFAVNPYHNTLRIVVKVTAGTNTLVRSRLVTLSGKVCAINSAPTPTAIPNGPPAVVPPTTPNYQVTQVTDAAVQIGTQQICWLPDATTAMSCDPGLNAQPNATSLNLLASGDDTLADGTQMRYVLYLTQTASNTYIQLKGIYINKGNATVLYPPLALGAPLPNVDTNPNDFTVIIQKPNSASDTYTAYIIWLNPSAGSGNQNIFVTSVTWSPSGIQPVGVYNNNGGGIAWGYLYNGTTQYVYANTQNITYNANANQLILNGNYSYTGNVHPSGKYPRFWYGNITSMTPASSTNNTPSITITSAACGNYPYTACSDPPDNSNTGYNTNPSYQFYNGGSGGTVGQSVTSGDGRFIVAPIQVTTGTPPATVTTVYIAGFNTSLLQRIKAQNTLLILLTSQTLGVAAASNIASLMTTDLPTPASTSNVEIKFYNGKFYWIVAGDPYVYEWDPKTWGAGQIGPSNPTATNQTLLQLVTNTQMLGMQAGGMPSGGSYTGSSGNFYGLMVNLVREIGPASGAPQTLWVSGDPAPQMVFNDQNQEIYIRDGAAIHRVNLQAGYYYNFLSAYTNGMVGTAGQMMAFDKSSDTLYFTGLNGVTNELYAYLPAQGITQTLTATSATGDNIFYASKTQQLYYVDVANGTPNIYAYAPYCYDLNQADNTASMLLTGPN